MKALRLTLVCHARTDAQRLGRFPLDEGIETDRLPRTPEPVARLLSAPEARARQSAALFGAEVECVGALRDIDMGRWAGVALKALQASEAQALARWLDDATAAPPGGESFVQVVRRVGDWLDAFSTPGDWLAVTHPMVIRAAMVHVLGAPPAAMHTIDVLPLGRLELSFAGRWRLRL